MWQGSKYLGELPLWGGKDIVHGVGRDKKKRCEKANHRGGRRLLWWRCSRWGCQQKLNQSCVEWEAGVLLTMTYGVI